ncbi:MAG: hypothetical protein M1812_002045 [Candelaria pacifica]|nr:MAG: hypothetical protein M1812_002045 [Candelaria pacifica]
MNSTSGTFASLKPLLEFESFSNSSYSRSCENTDSMESRPHHKRSKSALALSMLHRDKSKGDPRDEEGGLSNTASEAGSSTENLSPTVSHSGGNTSAPHSHGLSRIRSLRHGHHLSANTEVSGTGSTTSLVPPSPTASNATTSSPVTSPTKDPGVSIEQSVRTFRLFEALRSGDTAAISKAVRETSGLAAVAEDPKEEDTSLTRSPTGTSGSLEGTTILHLAIQCAEDTVIEYIISIAATTPGVSIDINARDRDGNTPLHLAAMLGRASTVRLLLGQVGINDSLANYQGRLPLDLAKTPDIFQQLQLARTLFLDTKAKEVQRLIANGDYDKLESLLAESRVQTLMDINDEELPTDPATTESGGTLLHEAARKRDVRLIQMMLLNGADPFRRDRKGKLPQDVTKDEKTRNILKKSPAAAAAQRGIQERAVLGNASSQSYAQSTGDSTLGGKEGREMKGYLKKWTNYTSGYKLRWFVLEDGVLSYYKHQDDAGSACRGAINMRIAKLYMDPQDKQRFEIQGKSSVKYHLKANHVVEAKRWFWALNNAIQWTKDEAKEEEKKKSRDQETLRQAKMDQSTKRQSKETAEGPSDASSISSGKQSTRTKGLIPGSSVGFRDVSQSRVAFNTDPTISADGEQGTAFSSYAPSLAPNDTPRITSNSGNVVIDGDLDDDDEYGDDASSHEIQPASKDAFNITAQSARLQLDLLAQVSAALQSEKTKNPTTEISSTTVSQAITSYESAVRSLKDLVGDLLKISRDRDAYWQYRLDREMDVRRMWEDSMARVAREQETLEGRIGESEDKRKRTKRALKEVLEGGSTLDSRPRSRGMSKDLGTFQEALETVPLDKEGKAPIRRKSIGFGGTTRRKSTIAEMTNLSDTDSDEDEEFFDAVDAGEVEIVGEMPVTVSSPPPQEKTATSDGSSGDPRETKLSEIETSFKGYNEPVRKRLKLDADDRPKISLWGILKSMVGKDMTKMTLPVSFNEPTSLLQRVAEDMEYTDLLDTAADRADSTERMVYVAAFACSEYASTIGRVAKPFNPLLGETFEYVRPDKGYRFMIEQVSHHPPIGACWAESQKWDYYGESNIKSKFYGKSFEINHLGTWHLKICTSTGTEELYTWKKVTNNVVGIITGNPIVDNAGPMEIKNWATGDVCILDFKPRGWKASSAYQVSGKVIAADGQTRWSIGGRWNDKIYARLTPGYDGPVEAPRGGETGTNQAFLVWETHLRPTGIPFNLTPFVVTLNALPEKLRPYLPPTDTRLRPDQRAMEDGEYDFAATEKNRVEEKQRAKRREREAEGEEFEPRWFTKSKHEATGEEFWAFNGEYWKVREEAAAGGGVWKGVEDIF